MLVAFSDLKKFKYTYWFAFPALSPATAFTVTATAPLAQRVSAAQADSLRSAYELWRHGDGAAAKPCPATEAGFFAVVVGADKCTVAPLAQFKALASSGTPVRPRTGPSPGFTRRLTHPWAREAWCRFGSGSPIRAACKSTRAGTCATCSCSPRCSWASPT